jgi:hypothetical protein
VQLTRATGQDLHSRHNGVIRQGLAAFELRGSFYLAIANEIVAPGATTTHTTLYRVDRVKH